MAKIILNDGTEEFLSPGAARAKVAAGEAVFAQAVPTYSTRQVVAEKPKAKEKAKPKTKRKRRTKAEIEADKAAADEAE